jgi:hypothetical protein
METMVRGQPIHIGGTMPVVAPTRALLGAQALASGGGVPLVATQRGPPAIMTRMSNINVLESQQKKSKALTILIMSMKDNVIPYIFDVEDPKMCWSLLQNMYEPKVRSKKIYLRNKLGLLQMSE